MNEIKGNLKRPQRKKFVWRNRNPRENTIPRWLLIYHEKRIKIFLYNGEEEGKEMWVLDNWEYLNSVFCFLKEALSKRNCTMILA